MFGTIGRPGPAVKAKPRTTIEKVKLIYQDEDIWNIVKSLTFFVVAIKFTREFKGVDLIR